MVLHNAIEMGGHSAILPPSKMKTSTENRFLARLFHH